MNPKFRVRSTVGCRVVPRRPWQNVAVRASHINIVVVVALRINKQCPSLDLHPSDEIAANRISPGRCLGA